MNYKNVYDILFLIAIQELTFNDYEGFLTEDDYRIIQRALYKVFGTSCVIPFPKHCSNMNTPYLNDISNLVHRVTKAEEEIEQIRNTKVIKPKDDTQYEINDIDLTDKL